MSNKKPFNSGEFINAVLYILIGILMIIFKASLLNWAMTAIGAVLIVIGILNAIKNHIVEGVITAALGVIVILGGWLFIDIILLILGVSLTVKGIFELFKALNFKYVPAIINSIITMVVGVLLVVSKWVLLDWFFIILGVIMIIDGILAALSQIRK